MFLRQKSRFPEIKYIMQLKSFKINTSSPEVAEMELNTFLRAHRILNVERHFCPEQGGYWAVLVEWAERGHADGAAPARRNENNVKESLNEQERERFEKYRRIRLSVSRATGVPPYALFTDKELAALSRIETLTAENASKVKDVSPAHLRDNLVFLLECVDDETSGSPDGADSAS